MADQVAALLTEQPRYQLGEFGAPCSGRSTCTDVVGTMIVRHDRGRTITAAAFRAAARPGDPTPCRGLTPAQFLRGLAVFGVRGYEYEGGITASDALRATDRGIVLVGVGYGAYPVRAECQVGGRTDMGFVGAHAISLWGRRRGEAYGLRPGAWVCWARDPDHQADGIDANGIAAPRYDRFDTAYLVRAIRALVGAGSAGGAWTTTFMIGRPD